MDQVTKTPLTAQEIEEKQRARFEALRPKPGQSFGTGVTHNDLPDTEGQEAQQ